MDWNIEIESICDKMLLIRQIYIKRDRCLFYYSFNFAVGMKWFKKVPKNEYITTYLTFYAFLSSKNQYSQKTLETARATWLGWNVPPTHPSLVPSFIVSDNFKKSSYIFTPYFKITFPFYYSLKWHKKKGSLCRKIFQ